jgi:hypothetical protein
MDQTRPMNFISGYNFYRYFYAGVYPLVMADL